MAVLTSHPPDSLTEAHHTVEDLTRVTATPTALHLTAT